MSLVRVERVEAAELAVAEVDGRFGGAGGGSIVLDDAMIINWETIHSWRFAESQGTRKDTTAKPHVRDCTREATLVVSIRVL